MSALFTDVKAYACDVVRSETGRLRLHTVQHNETHLDDGIRDLFPCGRSPAGFRKPCDVNEGHSAGLSGTRVEIFWW